MALGNALQQVVAVEPAVSQLQGLGLVDVEVQAAVGAAQQGKVEQVQLFQNAQSRGQTLAALHRIVHRQIAAGLAAVQNSKALLQPVEKLADERVHDAVLCAFLRGAAAQHTGALQAGRMLLPRLHSRQHYAHCTGGTGAAQACGLRQPGGGIPIVEILATAGSLEEDLLQGAQQNGKTGIRIGMPLQRQLHGGGQVQLGIQRQLVAVGVQQVLELRKGKIVLPAAAPQAGKIYVIDSGGLILQGGSTGTDAVDCGGIGAVEQEIPVGEQRRGPHTTVLFMARPTMSKTIYLQQLGRATRRCPGKEDLLVIDFVDNANMFNMPYSLHRVLDIAKYQPMAYVLAPENKRKLDQDMLFHGEKPEAWLDVPIDVSDYEIIDLFNWQNSVKDMISQIEFVRMVDVQSETVERYIKDGKVKPDLSIPFGDKRMFHYFREESIRNIAKQYGWDLITPQNMADKFMKFIETMDMSYSYKPVLLKAIYEYMDTSGRVALPDVVDYFIDFYENRKAHGMIAEKSTSIYQKGGYTRKDVEKNILSNPFKRFEDMRFLMRCKDVETIEVNPIIFRKLTREDWLHIVNVCDKSLEKYYLRLKK